MNSLATLPLSTPISRSRSDVRPESFVSSVDKIYSGVFDAILEGKLTPASRLTEETLKTLFATNRSVLRQVLNRLSLQQVITLRPNHLPRVAQFDREQIQQILYARRLAETTLVRLACSHRRQEDLTVLRTLLKNAHRDNNSFGAFLRTMGEFHFVLAQIASNLPLAHFLNDLIPRTLLAIAQHGESLRLHDMYKEHGLLIDALEKGDEQTAASLINRHIDHLEKILIAQPENPQTRSTSTNKRNNI